LAFWEKGKGIWHINCGAEVDEMVIEARREHNRSYKSLLKTSIVGISILAAGMAFGKASSSFIFKGAAILFLIIGIIVISASIRLALIECESFHRWKTWYGMARPYSESRHLMYPYNPHPNAVCWNCGRLIREPSISGYIKPIWLNIDGKWMAFCSRCHANVTKEVMEDKYGKPYRGERCPEFYHETSLWQRIRGKKACTYCGYELSSAAESCERCGKPHPSSIREG